MVLVVVFPLLSVYLMVMSWWGCTRTRFLLVMTEAERGRASPIPGEVCEKRARRESFTAGSDADLEDMRGLMLELTPSSGAADQLSAPEGGAQGSHEGLHALDALLGLLQGAPEDPGGASLFHIGFFVLAGLLPAGLPGGVVELLYSGAEQFLEAEGEPPHPEELECFRDGLLLDLPAVH